MDPNQTPPPQYPGNYPPQTPAPTQFGGVQMPQQPAQPYAQPVPPPQPYPQQQQAQPRPAPSPAAWYTPAPKPDADKPSDINSYLQAAGVSNSPNQNNASSNVPGQIIKGQYSVDYLDQMAVGGGSQAPDKKLIYLGAGLGAALILAAAMFFLRPQSATDNTPVKLYTTLVDTEKSTVNSARLLKSSKLSSINGNVRTSLTNAQRDMEEPLKNMGQKPPALRASAIKKPYHDEKFAAALEDARLNAVYDRVYANEINTKLRYIIIYMESIKKSNNSKSMQTFVDKNLPSFQTLQKSVEEYQKSEEANR